MSKIECARASDEAEWELEALALRLKFYMRDAPAEIALSGCPGA